MTAPSPIVKSGPSRAGAEYLKIRDLASGGMGSVELSRAISGIRSGQPVVLKRLHPHLEREQQFVSMLLDEAWITAGLHHPNIVEMFDMGQDTQGHFLVLEFVAGDSLLAIIRESKKLQVPIPFEVILYVTAKIAEGLHAAHELRNERGDLVHLVHRDVTPSNILLGMQGEVKLIDFGVAKSMERLSHTSAGTIKGKFGYMSPEQARGMAIDRRSDLFSLGVVLWEMLAQRRLYRSESELELLRMVVEEPAPPIRGIRADVPASLERLLNASLAKNRDDRLGSCAEFADFLWEAFSEVQGHTGPRELASFFKRVLPLRCTELAQLLIEVDEFSAPASVVRPVMHSFTDLPVSAGDASAAFDMGTPMKSGRQSLPFAATMMAPPGPSNRPPGRPRGDTPTEAMGPVVGVAVAGPGGNPVRPARLVVVPDPSVVYALQTEPPPSGEEPIHPTFLPPQRSPGMVLGVALGVLGALALGAAAVLGLNRRNTHSMVPHTSIQQSTAGSFAAASAASAAASSAAASASAAMLVPSAPVMPSASVEPTAAPTLAPPVATAEPTVLPTVLPTAAPTSEAAVIPSAAPSASAEPSASARAPRVRTPHTPHAPSAGGVSYEDAVRAMMRDPNAARPAQ